MRGFFAVVGASISGILSFEAARTLFVVLWTLTTTIQVVTWGGIQCILKHPDPWTGASRRLVFLCNMQQWHQWQEPIKNNWGRQHHWSDRQAISMTIGASKFSPNFHISMALALRSLCSSYHCSARDLLCHTFSHFVLWWFYCHLENSFIDFTTQFKSNGGQYWGF